MKRVAIVAVLGMLVSGCSSLNESLNGALGGDSSGESADVEVIEISEMESVSAGSATQDGAVEGEQVAFENQMQQADAPMDMDMAQSANGLSAPAQRLFFFGFDSSSITGEDLSVVQAHAAYLINNPVMIVRLEGHADERGSREYNLALGERRAQTMSDLLIAEGVNNGQIEILSYGEEKPLEMGHEEAFWAQNRRVELTYPQ
ncbi:MAG: peptidoglycan-associated lipoprotein Pal [Gammaproteobacteria bacterium]|jgi:peptidoglycan-associated lipoprotein|nr:peptidoglycan-associated lipoprotein Pal [Gammaproteobacteria bacterium]MBT5360788.1 peptidoglycan-associated lipoprotein Pal [Gammaproteobacteria bacterium]MBT6079764.1 peptidoglycan-associated lipoprotein Pal [Gammaproteobacteria bacterium]MBT6670278.1 peptidoglycan-associated lipoprotein Pal [Gammaproteobacteria bacterium]